TAMPLPLGSVMGHEFAGEVVEIGSAVRHLWNPGDRVAGFPVICGGEHTQCPSLSNGFTGCGKMLPQPVKPLLKLGHCVCSPPQITGKPATRSPGFQRWRTALPISTTSPANSCPITEPSGSGIA